MWLIMVMIPTLAGAPVNSTGGKNTPCITQRRTSITTEPTDS